MPYLVRTYLLFSLKYFHKAWKICKIPAFLPVRIFSVISALREQSLVNHLQHVRSVKKSSQFVHLFHPLNLTKYPRLLKKLLIISQKNVKRNVRFDFYSSYILVVPATRFEPLHLSQEYSQVVVCLRISFQL